MNQDVDFFTTYRNISNKLKKYVVQYLHFVSFQVNSTLLLFILV